MRRTAPDAARPRQTSPATALAADAADAHTEGLTVPPAGTRARITRD
ncbi:hypothetical protein [Streptomyces sp. NPDC004726]